MDIQHFCTEWFFPAPIWKVWEQITDLQSYPAKWPIWKRVMFRNSRSEVELGSIIDFVARGPLPITMHFTFKITALEPAVFMEYESSGDLVGTCSWMLESNGNGTIVTSCWDMGASILLVRFLPKIRLVEALMGKHHDYIMAQGYRGFRARLECG